MIRDTEKKQAVYTHRLVYELQVGPIPDGMEVCHTCDNPACCRSDHLFLGTQADNMRDAWAKGRNILQNPSFKTLRGDQHANSKLTTAQVLDIRARAERGESPKSLAKRFGIDRTNVWQIVTRRSWKHV